MEKELHGEGNAAPGVWVPTRTQVSPEYILVGEAEGQPGLSEDALVTSIKLLMQSIGGANSYIYFDEGILQYGRTLRVLYPWLSYGIQSAEHKPLSPQHVSQYVNLTAYLLESVQVDQMGGMKRGLAFTPISDRSSYSSRYGRFHTSELNMFPMRLDSRAFLLNSEISYAFHHADTGEKVPCLRDLDNVLWEKSGRPEQDFPVYLPVYLLEPFPSVPSLLEFRRTISQGETLKGRKPAKLLLNAWVRIDETVGAWLRMSASGDSLHAVHEVSREGIALPTTPVSTVDILKAYMRSGDWRGYYEEDTTTSGFVAERRESLPHLVNGITNEPLRKEIQQLSQALSFAEDETPLSVFRALIERHRQDYEPWQWNLLRKKSVQSLSFDLKAPAEQRKILDQVMQAHAEQYTRLLVDPEHPRRVPSVYFTRSGVSANAASFLIARQVLGEDVRAFELDGWYFENHAPKSWKTSTVEEANLLLVPLEPNPLQLDRTEKEYRKYRDDTLSAFLQRAARHPDQRFVLIADKTVNLIDHTYLPTDGLPPNVLRIETASISKHQRGSRANFYGMVAIWEDIDARVVDTAITGATGQLTPDSIFALPRLTREEIEKNLHHMQGLAEVFGEELEKAQRSLPEWLRWRWQPYGYYGFLLPSQEILAHHKKGKYDWFVDATGVVNAINSFIDTNPHMLIEKGDSFGFPQTRCMPFGIAYQGEDPKRYEGTVIRFSFGTKTPKEDFRSFSSFVIGRIVEKTKTYQDSVLSGT